MKKLHTHERPISVSNLGNALGLYEASLDVGLPNSGIPRMHHLEDKPWVFREFALIDPEANLLRVGKIIQPESEIEI